MTGPVDESLPARKWVGGVSTATPLIEWVNDNGGTMEWAEQQPDRAEHMRLETFMGTVLVMAGDWIIQTGVGTFTATREVRP